MQYAIYLYTILTIFGFWLALQISKRWKSMIFNTFVLTVSILVLILVVSDIPYDDYMAGNAPINNLLGVSIVALALPLYEQLRQIAKQWKIILSVVTLASLFSMFTGAIFAIILGASPEMVATVLLKSITTPIAMEVSSHLGRYSSRYSRRCNCCRFARFGFWLSHFEKLGIKQQEAVGFICWGGFSRTGHRKLYGSRSESR